MNRSNSAQQTARSLRRLKKRILARLKKMLVEILPGYTIKTVKTEKIENELKDQLDYFNRICTANSKLVYLIYIGCTCEYAEFMFGEHLNEYYVIFIGKSTLDINPDCSKDTLRRGIEQLQEIANTPDGMECNICMASIETAIGCSCKYCICHKCELTLMFNAIRETHSDVFYCPYCHRKRTMLAVAGDVRPPMQELISAFHYKVNQYREIDVISKEFANAMVKNAMEIMINL